MASPIRVMSASGCASTEITAPRIGLFRRPSLAPIRRSAAAVAGNGRKKTVISAMRPSRSKRRWSTNSISWPSTFARPTRIDIHHDDVAGRNIRLRLLHRLMRRALRPEAEARLGERRVPISLQHPLAPMLP
jgi:hypothetical protein